MHNPVIEFKSNKKVDPVSFGGRVLCVDLDGTLLATDLLWESLLKLLKNQPWVLFLLPFWLMKGKAFLKHKIFHRVDLEPETLPYRSEVIDLLNKEHLAGREIILTTGSNQRAAIKIGKYLGVFSNVLASNKRTNLVGKQKLTAINEATQGKEFDYIGNADTDLPIWQRAHEALLVCSSPHLIQKVRDRHSNVRILSHQKNVLGSLWKTIRGYQWVKNILVFVPLVVSHKFSDVSLIAPAIWAFLSLSFCASSGYVVNDLNDLDSDRRHLTKKFRPLASGVYPIGLAGVLIACLLGLSAIICAVFLPTAFGIGLGIYFISSVVYSLYLKTLVVVDFLTLALLHTFRVILGGLAVGIMVSPWLLGFSLFFFLSLALVKRFAEFAMREDDSTELLNGRGYNDDDMKFFQVLGPLSGFISVLVLALYLNSQNVVILYAHPERLWGVCVFLLYWISRVWFLTFRKSISDDPIVFAFKDPVSYGIGFATVLVIWSAI